jgi:putative hydrolase of the HAD superfamily
VIVPVKAVAFDIDGTLYPNWRLYLRITPYFLKNLAFFIQFWRVRHILHRTAPLPNFFEYQARLLAEFMHIDSADARDIIDRKVYAGLCRFFPRIRPYRNVETVFRKFREAGMKVAILSDFPPEQKGNIWGCATYCHVIMGSEECGALKPSKYTFGMLAKKLELQPEEILYVGNSIKSDVIGARGAGMKVAYLMPLWRRIFNRPLPDADISFRNYRQLEKIVLQ